MLVSRYRAQCPGRIGTSGENDTVRTKRSILRLHTNDIFSVLIHEQLGRTAVLCHDAAML